MSGVYSLHDALVSINVPDDKAKALIDAMEREMMDKRATKADLENLRVATKADFTALRGEMTSQFKLVRQEIVASRDSSSKDLQLVRANLEHTLTTRLYLTIAGAVTILGTLQALL